MDQLSGSSIGESAQIEEQQVEQSLNDHTQDQQNENPNLFIDDTSLVTEKQKITTIEEGDNENQTQIETKIFEDEIRASSSTRKKPLNQCMLLTATGLITSYKRPRNFDSDEGSYSDESERDERDRVPQTKEEKLWDYFLQVDYSQSSFPVLHCSSCFKQISHIQLVDIFPCGHIFHGSKCNESGLYCSLCKPTKQQKITRSNTKTNFVIEEPKAKKTPTQIKRAQTFASS